MNRHSTRQGSECESRNEEQRLAVNDHECYESFVIIRVIRVIRVLAPPFDSVEFK